jgi:hypothetical protein
MISGALAKSHDISDGAGPVVAVAVCLHGRGKAAPAGDLARCSHAEGGVYASASCQRPLRDHVALDLTLWRFKNYALRSGRGLSSSLTVSILAGCSLVRGIRRSSFVVKAAALAGDGRHVDLLSRRRPCTPSESSARRLRSVIIAGAIHRHTVLAHSNASSIHIEHGHVDKQRRRHDTRRFKFEFSRCSRAWDSIPGVAVVARRFDALTAVAHERVR